MCAKSTWTCVATLYLSLDVICGKVPEYVRSPWQIPLLFYGKTPGRRTGGGGRFCSKTRGLCMCASWRRREREISTEGFPTLLSLEMFPPNYWNPNNHLSHVGNVLWDKHSWLGGVAAGGVAVSKTYQQFLRSSALAQQLTLQEPAWFVPFRSSD